MLYTCKGDTGMSGLFGTKKRLQKNSPLYEALGTLDELNSLLGVCRARASSKKNGKSNLSREILNAQQCLFIVQAELAGADKTISPARLKETEQTIDTLEGLIQNPHAFVIPGAT